MNSLPTKMVIHRALYGFPLVVVLFLIGPAQAHQDISFELDVQPILTSHGCNAGACHGKQRGQNGFQLSLLGFDPEFDFSALTQEARGRRIFPAAPEHSLLLRKATATVPHGGGRRLDVGDDDYEVLRRWIAAGTPRKIEGEPKLVRIAIEPSELLLRPNHQQQANVTAFYSDGTTRDVTYRTSYQSNDAAIVSVDRAGMMNAGPIPGETGIMVRYMSMIAVCNVAIPMEGNVPDPLYANLNSNNFIDDLVWRKLKSLGITPSEPVDDAKFLRRVYVDIIGRLPAAEEVREFLGSPDANKRQRLVDALLERPEYVDHWANKWADLLRPNPYRVGIKAVLNYDNWIRDQFRHNTPYDQFVRELITARGSTWYNGAATMFRDRRSPEELTTIVSQLFLGIRLECAKCHHHPFEKWGQDDFYSFAAYFSRVGRKGTGLSPPISGSEEVILLSNKGEVRHPLTDQVLAPRPLFGEAADISDVSDPRETLAAWMTAPDNRYFAMVQVNRIWMDLMGRGIVEPVDDLRASNPPTNGPLLEALANYFRDQNYDLKQLIRVVATSQAYALSSIPTDRNVSDTRNFSRHYRQRLRGETLMDAVADITGTPHSMTGMPPRSSAAQIWTHRVDSLFLDTFGRPDANQDPPCERMGESTVTQTLHLMNAPDLHRRIASDQGHAAKLASSDMSIDEIVEQLYLMVYSRFPDADERAIGRTFFTKEAMARRRAAEDLMWALMNTPEFFLKD